MSGTYWGADARAVVGTADIVWATITRAWDEGPVARQQAMVQQFAGIAADLWAGIEAETVWYQAGYIAPEHYAAEIDALVAAASGSGGGSSGGGSGYTGSVDDLINYTQAEHSYVMNDGSGDIVYPDQDPFYRKGSQVSGIVSIRNANPGVTSAPGLVAFSRT